MTHTLLINRARLHDQCEAIRRSLKGLLIMPYLAREERAEEEAAVALLDGLASRRRTPGEVPRLPEAVRPHLLAPPHAADQPEAEVPPARVICPDPAFAALEDLHLACFHLLGVEEQSEQARRRARGRWFPGMHRLAPQAAAVREALARYLDHLPFSAADLRGQQHKVRRLELVQLVYRGLVQEARDTQLKRRAANYEIHMGVVRTLQAALRWRPELDLEHGVSVPLQFLNRPLVDRGQAIRKAKNGGKGRKRT